MKAKVILFFILVASGINVYGQKWMIPDKTIGEIKAICDPYFYAMHDTIPDSLFYAEGSEYVKYRQFMDFWIATVGLQGKVTDFSKAQLNNYNHRDNIPYIPDPWTELGPNNWTSDLLGIGPIEFVQFFPGNPSKMLCGSMASGLFFSTNAGVSWINAGSDSKWIHSGCAGAIFDINDQTGNSWYAFTAGTNADGDASFLGFAGGIYHTSDAGLTWSLMYDQSNFQNGIWTRYLQSKLINTVNGPVYAIATNCGLYFLELNTGVLSQVLTGFITDIEIHPTNNSILYACVNYTSANQFSIPASSILMSNDGGGNWIQMSGLPPLMTTFAHLTIEVCPSAPSNIYILGIYDAHGTNGNGVYTGEDAVIYKYDGINWTALTSTVPGTLFKVLYGRGYGFVVTPGDPNELFISVSRFVYKYTISGNTAVGSMIACSEGDGCLSCKLSHDDIEFMAFSPVNVNELWICSHGGLERYNKLNYSHIRMSDGLGVCMAFRFNSSVSSPDYLMIGAWHDATIFSTNSYDVLNLNTYPDWEYRCQTFADGMQPLVDPINPQNLIASGQILHWARSYDGGATFSPLLRPPTINANAPSNDPVAYTIFNTEGVQNKKNPSVIYFTALSNPPTPKEEVFRNINRINPLTPSERISDFETLVSSDFPGHYYYDVLGLYNSFDNSGYLYVMIQIHYLNNIPAINQIYRTKVVENQSNTSVQNSWEKLSLPRIADVLSGVSVSPGNPDILFLAYSSSSLLNTNSYNGTQMIYKVDYTIANAFPPGTCPNGLCEDLTYNLPNTGFIGNSILPERGTNSNLYLSTHEGVFFINAYYISEGTFWHKLGNLPHVAANSIEANYRNNKLRVATYGRGVWEHDLFCPFDPILYFPQNQNQNGVIYYEAINEVVSAASVSALSEVTYRAGTYVHLQPGFTASPNSTFHAFVHGCNQPGSSFKIVNDESGQLTYNDYENEPPEIEIFPNPSDGEFTLKVPDYFAEQSFNIVIYNTNGKEVFSQQGLVKITSQLSLQELPNGVYFIWVSSGENQYSQKIVIND
jgi:Secretion system C-terminal sorting domain